MRRNAFRVGIALYILTISGLIAAFISISTRDLNVAAYVQVPETFKIKSTNALRTTVTNASTGSLYTDADVSFEIGGTKSATTSSGSGGFIVSSVVPPADAKTLRIDVRHRSFEPFTAQAEVKTATETPKPEPRSRRDEREKKSEIAPDKEGKWRLFTTPANGEIVRGLTDHLDLFVYDAKTFEPFSGTIKIEKIEGVLLSKKPKEWKTDEDGHVRIDLKAETSIRWHLKIPTDDGEETARLNAFSVPAQFTVNLSDLLVRPSQKITGQIQSLHQSGGVLVDLYDDNHWVAAEAFGINKKGGGFRFTVPETGSGIYRVQLYRDIFGTDRGWNVAYLATASTIDIDGCRDANARVWKGIESPVSDRFIQLSMASELSLRRCQKLLAAGLRGLPRAFSTAPIAINTQQADRAALEKWRAEWQFILKVGTGVVLGIGMLILLLFVLMSVKSSRAAQIEMMAIADDDEMVGIDRFDRAIEAMRIVIVLLSLASFGASMIMLLGFF